MGVVYGVLTSKTTDYLIERKSRDKHRCNSDWDNWEYISLTEEQRMALKAFLNRKDIFLLLQNDFGVFDLPTDSTGGSTLLLSMWLAEVKLWWVVMDGWLVQ